MFRLFRGFVAEGLGLGGLLWAMTLLSGPGSSPTFQADPSGWSARPSRNSPFVVTLQKPPIFASLEPPTERPLVESSTLPPPTFDTPTLEAERPTFFRGTDSLFERRR